MLFKKMTVFQEGSKFEGQEQLALPTTKSTLIEADLTLFHALPEPSSDAKPEPDQAKVTHTDYERGKMDGIAQSERLHQNAVTVMQTTLDHLQAEMKTIASSLAQAQLNAVINILRHTFPSLMQAGFEYELRHVLEKICQNALEGNIALTVNPEDKVDADTLCLNRDINITVTTDPSVQPRTALLKWESGGAEIDTAKAADTCLSILANLTDTGDKP